MREKWEILAPAVQKEGRKNRTDRLIRAVSAAGMAAGFAGSFFGLAGSRIFYLPVLAAALCALCICGLDQLTGERLPGSFAGLFTAMLVFVFNSSGAVRGIWAWGDRIREQWNQVFGTYYESFFTAEYTGADLWAAGLVLGLLAGTVICELVKKERLFLLTLCTGIPLCAGLLLAVHLPAWIPGLLAAGWLTAWCRVTNPAGTGWGAPLPAVLAGVLLCLLLPVSERIPWRDLSEGFQTRAGQGIRAFRYGEDTLPGGDLTMAGHMLEGTEARLEVESSEKTPLYLRGFVGSEYEGDAWRPLPAEDYSGTYTGMLSWLAEQEFCPGAQYAAGSRFLAGEDDREASVSVKNVGASRCYVYLPETVSGYPENAGYWMQDWSMRASGWFGARSWSFTCAPVQAHAETQVPEAWAPGEGEAYEAAERFRQAEGVYRAFVYEHYLDVGEEEQALIDGVFFQGEDQEEGGSLYTVTSRIRTVLCLVAEYQEHPEDLPAGRDFLSWFLQEEKEGNAVGFASTAVLAYRCAGIPARYAEGYLLTEEQAGGGPVTLTSQDAHAWVEVYVDGMGWRAVEVTPGFYEEVYEAEVVVAVSSEDIEGTADGLAGIPHTEEYELPEPEEEAEIPSERKGPAGYLLSVILILGLLPGIVWMSGRLVLAWRYVRMTEEEKMYFLYRRIMGWMSRLYEEFDPGQPLVWDGQTEPPFDAGLYGRTVRRMERIIYGETGPAAGEIPAAEALLGQVRRAAIRKRRTRFGRRKGDRKEESVCRREEAAENRY